MQASLPGPWPCLSKARRLLALSHTRRIHDTQPSRATFKRTTAPGTTGERAISLLEELFPSSTFPRAKTPQKRPERRVPKLALDAVITPEDSLGETDDAGKRRTGATPLRNRDLAVLVLNKASRFLDESDFRRAAPSGKHIEGWTNQGDILKIIRGRNVKTLEASGTYFLVFQNPASAQAYKDNAAKLHRYSKMHIPQGLTGALPPPPNLDANGRLVFGSIETYTLIPPSHELDMKMVIQPFSPILREVVENSGYAALMDGRLSDHEVLLSVEAVPLSAYALRGALAVENRTRGTQWATAGRHAGVRTVRVVPDSEKSDRAQDSRTPTPPNPDDDVAMPQRQPKGPPVRLPRQRASRFIMSFKNESEAKRFATAWHRKDIAPMLEGLEMRAQEVIVDAEVIW